MSPKNPAVARHVTIVSRRIVGGACAVHRPAFRNLGRGVF